MDGSEVALDVDSVRDPRWDVGLDLLEASGAAIGIGGLTLVTDPANDTTRRRLHIEIPCRLDPVLASGPARVHLQRSADRELGRARRLMKQACGADPRFAQLFDGSGVVYEYVHEYAHEYGMGSILVATARRSGPWIWK